MKALIDHKADVNARRSARKLWFRSFTNDYTLGGPRRRDFVLARSAIRRHRRDEVAGGATARIPSLPIKPLCETPLHAAAGIGFAWNWTVRAPAPAVDAVKYCVDLGNDVNAVDNRTAGALPAARRGSPGR